MNPSSRTTLRLLIALALFTVSSSAQAIPAFARKYGTSCQTCHTVYPRLTPFGEAFRRDGYRFPGVDSDYAKQEPVALGQEAAKKSFPDSMWPGMLPGYAPLALGFNGKALIHPNKHTTGAQADNGTQFSLQDLVAEAHLWAGGSFDDKNTFWGELTFAGGGASIERAQVLFNDLLGPKHWVNGIVGRGISNLSSFAPHSSYIGDTLLPSVPVTALYGAQGDSFNIQDNYNFVELNGVLAGRVLYNVGINSGQHFDIRPTENVYGHLGVKLGGMRADGEGSTGPQDALRPWAETALTLDGFAYHSNSHFTPAGAVAGDPPRGDAATTVGGGLRGQWGSLELNTGVYSETHGHAQPDGTGARVIAQYNELSYIVFPWLVPALRVEYIAAVGEGGPQLHDVRFLPGFVALVRPNLKFTVVAQIERANGAPPGGWGGVNGLAAPTAGPITELEAITVGLATAF